jgi:hypothetical protein
MGVHKLVERPTGLFLHHCCGTRRDYRQLLSHVDRAMRLEPTWRGKCSTRNFSSAIRVFVIEQCEPQATAATEPACEMGYLITLNHLRSAMP